MSKFFIFNILFNLFFFSFGNINISASEIQDNFEVNNYLDAYQDIYYQAGIDDIVSRCLGCEASEQLKEIFDFEKFEKFEKEEVFALGKEEAGIQKTNKNLILKFSPTKICKIVFEKFRHEIKNVQKFIFELIAVIFISGILKTFKICFSDKNLDEIFNAVSVLCVFAVVGQPIIECVKSGEKAILDVCDLVKSFMPVYLGMMSTCGLPLTGSVYNIFMISACQLFSQILSERMLDMIGIYLVFCLVGAMTPDFNIVKAAKGIKNFVSWILVILVTLFTGLVTTQGVFSSGADTMGTKTAKFVLGSAVPVIGSAISDAYTSIKSCFNFIRSSSGVMIIILIVVLFASILVKLTIYFLVTKLTSVLADFLGTSQISQFLQSCGEAIGLLLAIIISYIVIVLFGTTVILFFGMG